MQRAIVIIPTYNEIDSLEEAVSGVLAYPDYGVLVVDDDAAMRDMLIALLEDAGGTNLELVEEPSS